VLRPTCPRAACHVLTCYVRTCEVQLVTCDVLRAVLALHAFGECDVLQECVE